MKTTQYIRIQKELEKRIRGGVYPVGEQMPTEHALAEEFGVNRHTLRRAMNYLLEKSYIRRAPRVGSVVISAAAKPDTPVKTRLRYIFFSGGSQSPAEKLRQQVYEQIVQEFRTEYDWIEIELCPLKRKGLLMCPYIPEFSEPGTAVVVQLDYIADYASRGAFLPLDEFPELAEVTGCLDGRLLRRTRSFDGSRHIHALPVRTATWMSAVNFSLFQELGFTEADLPRTWAEFISIAAVVQERGNKLGVHALDPDLLYAGSHSMTRYLAFIYSQDHDLELAESDGILRINRPETVAFLEWLREIYRFAPDTEGMRPDLFISGKAVFRLAVTAGLFSQFGEAGINPEFEMRPLALPLRDQDCIPATVVNGSYVGIMAHSVTEKNQKQAAWNFIRFLCGRKAQAAAYKRLDDLPARTDMYPVVAAKAGTAAFFYDYAFRYGRPAVDLPKNNDIHRIIYQSFFKVLTGKSSTQKSLNEAQALLNDYVFRPHPLNPGNPFSSADAML